MKKYYGVFERVKKFYPESINECPFYYKEAADLYDQLAVTYDDYSMFLQQAVLFGGPILELCCGSGRLTLPLLKAGYKITAVDLSDDMLANLNQQLSKSRRNRKIKDNLRLISADMTKLNLNQKYNLIIIGATSIRLVEEDFIVFFNKMYDLLNTGGCLYFNFENLPIRTDKSEAQDTIFVTDLENAEGKLSLICMQRTINYIEKRASVNFIKVTPGVDEKLLLSQTEYRIFGIDTIKSAAEKSAFGSCEIKPVSKTNDYFCKMIKK